MNVLFQNRSNAFEMWGGDTTQMVETKENLEKKGVTVDIDLTTNPDVSKYDIVHIFNIQNPSYGIKQLLNAKKNNIPVALSTIYWDLDYNENSHEKYLYSESSLVRKITKINYRLPFILSKLNIPANNYKQKSQDHISLMLDKSDIILPNSFSELEILSNTFKMPKLRCKAKIVPNGIKFFAKETNNRYLNENIKLPKKYVLQVGRFVYTKGQLKVIKALFDNPEIPLVFIGSDLNSFYGQKCIELGKKRTNTFFFKDISHENIYSYYKNAKVHVLPSYRESPGLSTLEAAVCGVNCVVSFHAPIAEYFGFNVYCCDPSNIPSIKESIVRAWNTPKNTILKNEIMKSFTWEIASQKTLDAYNHILKK